MQFLRGNADLGTQPNSAPSVNAVDVLTYTAEASVILQNTLCLSLFSEIIASLCLELYLAICSSASLNEETVFTAIL